MNNVKLLPSLLVFAEVAKQQSFTKAAKQLRLSKSAISQQIKKLEHEVGKQLLSRNTRGMSLTFTGEKLLRRCELLKDQVDLAFEELDNNKAMPSGKFSITIPHSFEKEIVIPALNQLCSEYPKIQPELHVSDKPKDLIRDKFDVSIFGGKLKDSNYRALYIGSTGENFYASVNYLQKYGYLKELKDLQSHKIIAASWQKTLVSIYKANEPSNKQTVSINYFSRTNTLSSVYEMVLNHMGIAMVPDFIIQSDISNGYITRVLPQYQGQQWSFNLLHRFQGEKPIQVTRFHQLVKHYFSKLNSQAIMMNIN